MPTLLSTLVIGAALLAVTPATAAAAGPPPAVPASAEPPTRAEARRWLDVPRRALGLGWTNRGQLERAAQMPRRGRGFALFPHIPSRETHYGTPRLIALFKHVAGVVADRHPDSRLYVGNLGFRDGGKIPWSVSHQGGRDGDLAMYTLDRRGKPARLSDFARFDRDGKARAGGLTFDDARNLTLVRALMESDRAQVQYIFVARWLRERLLARAARENLPQELQRRMAIVLHQPGDSAPHDDHFHVRIFCSLEERLHGCHERGPMRDWVDLGDASFEQRVQDLSRVVSMRDAKLRQRACDKLGTLRAEGAVPALVAALGDGVRSVRVAALSALRVIRSSNALPGLLTALRTTQEPRWAAELFDAMRTTGGADVVEAAVGVVLHPEDYLHRRARSGARREVQATAAAVLERHGRKEATEALAKLLQAREPDVRAAAHDALLRVTNQPLRARPKARGRRARQQLVARWKAFLSEHEGDRWWQWIRLGFEARGYRFRGRMLSPGAVPTLIRAVGDRDMVASHNAVRALGEITGHHVDPHWRSKRKNQRYWRKWWGDNSHRFAAR